MCIAKLRYSLQTNDKCYFSLSFPWKCLFLKADVVTGETDDELFVQINGVHTKDFKIIHICPIE